MQNKQEKQDKQDQKEKRPIRHTVLDIIGIALCVLLIPLLVMNCTLLLKGMFNKDEVPDVGGVLPLIIYTDSMSGVFESGDLIFCKTVDPTEVKENDIIAFFDPAGNGMSIVTHRVLRVESTDDGVLSFVTKGDANNVEDRIAVPAEKLVGRYTDFHIDGLGNVALFMQTTPGLILCVFLPVVLIVAYDIIRRKLYEKKHADDKDDLMRELEQLRVLKAQAMAVVAKSGAASTPVAQDKPAAQVRPAPQVRPAGEQKPAAQVRPVGEASSAAQDKPAEPKA